MKGHKKQIDLNRKCSCFAAIKMHFAVCAFHILIRNEGIGLEDIFSDIKAILPMSEAARYYGLYINGSGMACCPFHDDKNPSLKIYPQNYFCFGCGVSGDAVSFAAKLYNLNQYQAALKISDDFGLNLTKQDYVPKSKNILDEIRHFEHWEKSAFQNVCKYLKLLLKWRDEHKPKSQDEPLHPLFVESLQEMVHTEYLCDILTVGRIEDKKSIYENNQDSIKRIADRVKAFEQKKIRRGR